MSQNPSTTDLISLIETQRAEIDWLLKLTNDQRKYIQEIQTQFKLIKVITDTYALNAGESPCKLPSTSTTTLPTCC
jgi:hypothetical protein